MASFLEGNIKVPGVGEVPKAAAAVGVLGVGYLIYRYRQNQANAGTAAAGQVTDPAGNVCAALDPNSGYCPGSTQDQAYYGTGAQQCYDINNNPVPCGSPSDVTSGLPGTAGYGGGGGGGGGSGGPPFSTNAQWSQYVLTTLPQDNPGIDVGALSTAIGLYIGGQPVDASTQEPLINEAIAIAGTPPVAGTNGMPPGINVSGSKGGGGKAQNPVTGLKVTDQGSTSVDISWNPARGATSYTVTATKGNATVTGTTAHIGSVNPSNETGDSTTIRVQANPYQTGQQVASIRATTKKGGH